jgi:hypothetical protein
VALVKAIEDIADDLIFIKRLAKSAQLISEAFHLCEVLISRQGQLFCIVQPISKMLHFGPGGRRKHGSDSFPRIGGGVYIKNMREDVRGQRIQQEPKHLLITCEPCTIGWVGNGDLVLVSIFSIQGLGRWTIRSIEESQDISSAKSWVYQSLPREVVVAREGLCRRVAESSSHGGSSVVGRGHDEGKLGFVFLGCRSAAADKSGGDLVVFVGGGGGLVSGGGGDLGRECM